MRLAEYFRSVAAKRLSAVEAHPERSNQHEFNGVGTLRDMLGDDRKELPTRFIYLTDNETAITADGSCTWYDARENHPTRTEYRFYFPSNQVMDMAASNDLILFCLNNDGTMMIVIGPEGGTSDHQLQWLFDVQLAADNARLVIGPAARMESEIGFAGQYILEELGIELTAETDDDLLQQMLDLFGGTFPTTAIFSDFARGTLTTINPLDGPDEALMTWFEQEEKLFRAYEKHIVSQRIKEGFGENGDDVDAFVKYSLSVLNRRKSRVGFALENHLEKVFSGVGLDFSAQCKTENRKKPDFIFPGCAEYHGPNTNPDDLTMLGVKTTCKDRWRQVLSEAEKITNKHLLTLEPGISLHQTDEMRDSNLQLVIPAQIHESYTQQQQQGWLMNVGEFIELVKNK
ncbi:MAG: restriction endonuclease [Pseudodesulfovibrio sp.]|nr:restriction endonuclease [Pseudodesulfovibrio sp.]